jgi:hypothetical protein
MIAMKTNLSLLANELLSISEMVLFLSSRGSLEPRLQISREPVT